MIPKEPLQEGILPSLDKRRKILERARQVLRQACLVTDELDQLRRGPHGEGSTQRFSANSPARTSQEQLARAE